MAEVAYRRRDLVVSTACVALAGLATTRATAAPLDLDDPAERLRAYMLMRGALDDRLVIGWASGRHYGTVDGVTRPLFGFVSATFARYRAAPGGYEAASHEVAFYTDLAGTTLLEHWENPYTGEVVPVPQPEMPPAKFLITADLRMRFDHLPAGVTLDHEVLPPVMNGEDVWMVEQTFVAIGRPGAAASHVTEIVTLQADRAALREGVGRVPTRVGYQGIGDWRPWQRMGDRAGIFGGDGFGRYGVAMSDIPSPWREIARVRRPEVLGNPAASLAKLLET